MIKHALTFPFGKLYPSMEDMTMSEEKLSNIVLEDESIENEIGWDSSGNECTPDGSLSNSASTLPLSQTSRGIPAIVNVPENLVTAGYTPVYNRFRIPRPQVYSILPYLRFQIPHVHIKRF